MRSALFYGAGTALVTTFRDGRVHYDALERLIDWQIDCEADALIVLGTTGEPNTVTASERRAIVECAVARCAGRVPLIAGAGSNDTRLAVEYAVEAQLLGADAILVVTPYYNKASRDGILRHFYAVADSVEIPVIVYNVPSRTGMCLKPETIAELARHPMIRGVKEAHCDLSHLVDLARLCGDGMAIYSGNDLNTLTMMALGARGVISVAANVAPEAIHDLAMAWIRGDPSLCRALQFRVTPLIQALSCEVNPIPVKAALSMMGRVENELRLPLTPLSAPKEQRIRDSLHQLGIL